MTGDDVAQDEDGTSPGTAWDLPFLEPHAEPVEGPRGRYWVVVQPAGALVAPVGAVDGDIATPYAETSLTLEVLGAVVNRVVFRGRWSARVVLADERGRATRRVVQRDRVPPDAVLAHAARLQEDVRAGRLPVTSERRARTY